MRQPKDVQRAGKMYQNVKMVQKLESTKCPAAELKLKSTKSDFRLNSCLAKIILPIGAKLLTNNKNVQTDQKTNRYKGELPLQKRAL